MLRKDNPETTIKILFYEKIKFHGKISRIVRKLGKSVRKLGKSDRKLGRQ